MKDAPRSGPLLVQDCANASDATIYIGVLIAPIGQDIVPRTWVGLRKSEHIGVGIRWFEMVGEQPTVHIRGVQDGQSYVLSYDGWFRTSDGFRQCAAC
jgi:hypothetical protein